MSRHIKMLLLLATAIAATLAVFGAGAASAGTSDGRLLATFQPVTRFDPQERFLPTSVQSFIADASLEQLTPAGWVVADPDPEPGNLPALLGPGTGAWRLDQETCSPA